MLYKIQEDDQEKIQSKTVTSRHYVGGHHRLAVDEKVETLWLFWEILAKVIVALKNKTKNGGFWFKKIHRPLVKKPAINLVLLLAFPNTRH